MKWKPRELVMPIVDVWVENMKMVRPTTQPDRVGLNRPACWWQGGPQPVETDTYERNRAWTFRGDNRNNIEHRI